MQIADLTETVQFVSPYDELLALESLYSEKGASLKKITEATVIAGRLPSEVLRERMGLFNNSELLNEVRSIVDSRLGSFQIAVNGTPGWPLKLSDSERPTPLLYYQGDLSLIESVSVSVVGSRKATENGLRRARKISRELVASGVTVVTGLARGIDTKATQTALDCKGRVIGVIGTPIDEVYPKENKELQETVAREHLLISQVPFYRYATEPFNAHRTRFPERNELMAAVSDATIIVEASDTSGTLTQAKACLHQKRPLFIMRSLVENSEITWPKKYIQKPGVHILDETSQVLDALGCRQ